MRWKICYGNILNMQADALICSANVQLNLSGGVGGEILVRHGDQMQNELRRYLTERNISVVLPGTVVETTSCGAPFSRVLHAVAVDAFYETSHELIVSTLQDALTLCSENEMKAVVSAALATGYGRYPIAKFALVLQELQKETFPGIKTMTLCLKNKYDVDELLEALENSSSNSPILSEK